MARQIDPATDPREAFLGFPVGAGDAPGECCFQMTGKECGEGRDEIFGLFVVEHRRTDIEWPTACFKQVKQVGGRHPSA